MKANLTILMATIAISSSAQIHVLPSGHVIIGEKEQEMTQGGFTLDTDKLIPDTSCAMTIDGKQMGHVGGTISFGNAEGVRIGEASNDVLTLYGAKGLNYSSNYDGLVLNYSPKEFTTTTNPNRVTFYLPVQASQFYTTSDMRLKSDISVIEGSVENLKFLTPVSYRLNIPRKEVSAEDGKIIESKEKASASERRQYGFLAQEVKEIYPELVCEDEEGTLAVDYQGFIPLLVDAVNTLQATVAKQEKIIEELAAATGYTEKLMKSAVAEQATLGQNRPNPATNDTQIDFFIPEGVVSAAIELTSADGLYNQRYDIGERGKGVLKIEASKLVPGIYVYTLTVDNEEVGTKRLIVSY